MNDRMTIERAEQIAEKHKVHLGHMHMCPSEENGYVACAAGLLLVDAVGRGGSFDFLSMLNNRFEWYASHGPFTRWGYDVYRLRSIADKINVPRNYILGLDQGFEGEASFSVEYADPLSQDFLEGLEDGRALAETLKEAECETA